MTWSPFFAFQPVYHWFRQTCVPQSDQSSSEQTPPSTSPPLAASSSEPSSFFQDTPDSLSSDSTENQNNACESDSLVATPRASCVSDSFSLQKRKITPLTPPTTPDIRGRILEKKHSPFSPSRASCEYCSPPPQKRRLTPLTPLLTPDIRDKILKKNHSPFSPSRASCEYRSPPHQKRRISLLTPPPTPDKKDRILVKKCLPVSPSKISHVDGSPLPIKSKTTFSTPSPTPRDPCKVFTELELFPTKRRLFAFSKGPDGKIKFNGGENLNQPGVYATIIRAKVYVGVTLRPISIRFHEWGAKANRRTGNPCEMSESIRAHLDESSVTVLKRGFEKGEDAGEIEKEWIELTGARTKEKGFNKNRGGGGGATVPISQEVIQTTQELFSKLDFSKLAVTEPRRWYPIVYHRSSDKFSLKIPYTIGQKRNLLYVIREFPLTTTESKAALAAHDRIVPTGRGYIGKTEQILSSRMHLHVYRLNHSKEKEPIVYPTIREGYQKRTSRFYVGILYSTDEKNVSVSLLEKEFIKQMRILNPLYVALNSNGGGGGGASRK